VACADCNFGDVWAALIAASHCPLQNASGLLTRSFALVHRQVQSFRLRFLLTQRKTAPQWGRR
jgi:hypothetical protein